MERKINKAHRIDSVYFFYQLSLFLSSVLTFMHFMQTGKQISMTHSSTLAENERIKIEIRL